MLKHLRNRGDFEQKNLLQKGFTLVELLVVIVILGILAAVVVFAVGGSTDKAQTSSCKAEQSALESAVEAYRASVGSYPSAAQAGIDQLTGSADDGSGVAGSRSQFLREDPSWHTLGAGGVVTATGKCA